MRTHTKIALILGLIAAMVPWSCTFVQFPTTDIFRLLGQLVPCAFLGLLVFGITYAIGALIVKSRRR